jgi:hypothetical protein
MHVAGLAYLLERVAPLEEIRTETRALLCVGIFWIDAEELEVHGVRVSICVMLGLRI